MAVGGGGAGKLKDGSDGKEGGLGTKWPKGMWDNMDSEWRKNKKK